MYPSSVENLVTQLKKLPGIGGRSAQRLAFHILKVGNEEVFELAEALKEVKEKVKRCKDCFNLTDHEICDICNDPARNEKLICVVEEPNDVISIERTHEFKGLYHVIGGALSPMDGIHPEDLKLNELFRRLHGNNVTEILVATNPTTTGEATALYIADKIKTNHAEIKVTRLASGLPVGADIEYADELTLGRALMSRQQIV